MAETAGKELSKVEKAAVLLMSMPPDVAAKILKELTEEEIQKIFLTAARKPCWSSFRVFSRRKFTRG